jgi:hypothetical protein
MILPCFVLEIEREREERERYVKKMRTRESGSEIFRKVKRKKYDITYIVRCLSFKQP